MLDILGKFECGTCDRFKEMPKVNKIFNRKLIPHRYCKVVSRIIKEDSPSCVSYENGNNIKTTKNNINTIVNIYPIVIEDETDKYYSWQCPICGGSYSYSKKINNMWGHPENKLFCFICKEYFDFII